MSETFTIKLCISKIIPLLASVEPEGWGEGRDYITEEQAWTKHPCANLSPGPANRADASQGLQLDSGSILISVSAYHSMV